MKTAVENLAEDAVTVELLDIEGTNFPVVSGDDDDGDDHDHDHGYGKGDPHGWLDLENGKLWLAAIAETLSQVDPDNAVIYDANAHAAEAEIDFLVQQLEARLAPVQGRGHIVFHDAYGHFQAAFDLPGLGAISLSDAVRPSAARLSELRDRVVSSEAVWVFSEPQFDTALVETLVDGTPARSGVLDPLGSSLASGPTLYPMLLENLGNSLADCLTP
ncbi:zinc transport system substrate-binding protein [Jannaschia pohangensis]|uniref:High-affinity zinc uptake system protein ZnuA n=1 Tax=Jannaschia pohangensis TaxID=390807 RepID=A0A1I3NVX0_9RHOB|nr:zinc transport system substrate-binding protein [Jannaschia pohangensis]